ncbi:MAG: 4-hydroxythreonine-4-phosphate dehydrogenase PdxA [Bacteroidetes bacterium]|jgi:4-hydroxythreonine-4-phosphate dehydrogenase|nr:4-hydroxythreonine-4-phosphate dehydrogenase PdxA [Bacteroidota bacterium]
MTPIFKTSSLPRIGITQGDINGIGYEVILKVLCDSRIFEAFTPIVYGQSKVFSYYKKNFGMEEMSYTVIRDASQAQPKRINIINHTDEELKVEPGFSTPVAGKASFAALKLATNDLRTGLIDALVTAPINKSNIISEQFQFKGQTDYIKSFFPENEYITLLVNHQMRIGFVTNHIPLREVPQAINKELIIKKLKLMHNSLINDFNIVAPKIAVLGLNPHAGDNNIMGSEEQEIIKPAIEVVKEQGVLAFGPFPADGFFGSDAWLKYDGILSMYHDQGLTPFRVLAFDGGVSFTAGLPVVRTSTTHGTGYDIANKNIADPEALRHAIYLAIDILNNRS